MLTDAEASRAGQPRSDFIFSRIEHQIWLVEHGEQPDRIVVPDYQPVTDFLDKEVDPELRARLEIHVGRPVQPIGRLDYLDRLLEAYEVGFGEGVEPPDDRDEHEFIKKKLERKISDLTPSPNTITRVAERYYDFNSIRPRTRNKYRCDVARLTEVCGDIPLKHVGAEHLRTLRDQLTGTLKGASVHALFTPKKGHFLRFTRTSSR
jgi:hypothetical protein